MTAVPEPSTGALLAVGLMVLRSRTDRTREPERGKK